MIKPIPRFALVAVLSIITMSIILLPGCGKENGMTPPAAKNGTAVPVPGTMPAPGAPAQSGHGGPVIELGATTIGPFAVRASRDQGEIKPGGDAPIDVWLTPAPGTPNGGGDIAKVTAVRLWIGTERGEDFVKAKADIEIPSEPNHWHTHAEVPSPLPAGSKLWVEIEVDGQKQVGSFDLKT